MPTNALLKVDPSARPMAALDAVREGRADLAAVDAAAAGCRACDLWARATQTVFGEGPTDARIVLIGEQPGDAEDRAGRPFVGPAGRILDEALAEAGIDRERVFVTNVVKHFKWRPASGSKRRLHERPNRAEVVACRPWVDAEVLAVKPEAVGLLGATAAQSLLGATFSLTRDHGRVERTDLAPVVVATFHPSAVLRSRGRDERAERFAELVADLRLLTAVAVARRFPVRRSPVKEPGPRGRAQVGRSGRKEFVRTPPSAP
jgi:uracil-DNA glycosylase family protein